MWDCINNALANCDTNTKEIYENAPIEFLLEVLDFDYAATQNLKDIEEIQLIQNGLKTMPEGEIVKFKELHFPRN